MLIVETIAKIRRLHFTESKVIKTICRDLKVVRKVIRTGITEFTYTRAGCWNASRNIARGSCRRRADISTLPAQTHGQGGGAGAGR